MKQIFKLSIILLFIACESVDNVKEVEISTGYLFGEQGKQSFLSYYDIKKDSLEENVYSSNNKGSILSGYLQDISSDGELIFLSLQGEYNTGRGRKIIALNKELKELGNTDIGPNGYNLWYHYPRRDEKLFVTYYSSSKGFELQVLNYAKSNTSITFSEGNNYHFIVKDYSGGKLSFLHDLILTYGPELIEIVKDGSFQLVDTLRTSGGLTHAVSFQNKFYVSFMIFNKADASGNQSFKAGGMYVVNNAGQLIDTVKTNYGIVKMYVSGNKLYASKWVLDSKKSLNWSTTYQNLKTYIVEFDLKLQARELFENSKLKGLSSGYLNFAFDANKKYFIIPNGAFSNDISTDVVDMAGNILKTLNHSAQVIAPLILTEKK